MNIKEHIEAGHYEKDEDGHELVPTDQSERLARIEGINGDKICGWLPHWYFACTWSAEGKMLSNGATENASPDLLPPPPRKVKVRAWAQVRNGQMAGPEFHPSDLPYSAEAGWKLIELTGEYEEPWS